MVPVPADQLSIDPELEKVKYHLTLTEENLASTELENEKLLRQIALLAEPDRQVGQADCLAR